MEEIIKFDLRNYMINDFNEWQSRKELELSPKFQRRRVWSNKAKSYLIDTIIREYPIPFIFIRQKVDPKTKKSIREVVDGQQRLSAILEFLKDGFVISKNHNKEYGGFYFSELPEEIQQKFLEYSIACNLLMNTKDEIILGIFARLNTYTVSVNKPELFNSKYFGLFKNTIHALALEFYTFWTENRILTENNIARMIDVELTSELIIASMDSIQGKGKIEDYYKKYDDDFQNMDMLIERFEKTMDTIGAIYGDNIQKSLFHKKPLFYSLYCVIFDLIYGLKEFDNKITFDPTKNIKIRSALEDLESIIEESPIRDLKPEIQTFIDDYSKQTTDINKRKSRHKFLIEYIRNYLNGDLN